MIDGMINVYKERGFTSHDVVAKLRGILKQKKIGHTGTLDPDAEGVLPVCLGKGTRLCDLLTDKDKTYEATLLLGIETDTQDIGGSILSQKPVMATGEQILAAVQSFVGTYDQIPPMYSALKVDGKKLYELAREGREVERKARRVIIYQIDAGDIVHLEQNRVELKLTVQCSKGTYIRTLCHDIGQKLGCGGCMSELIRISVGMFKLDQALKLSQIEQAVSQQRIIDHIFSVESFFAELPQVYTRPEADRLIHNGNALYAKNLQQADAAADGQQYRIYDSQAQFVGIYQFSQHDQLFKVVKMFL